MKPTVMIDANSPLVFHFKMTQRSCCAPRILIMISNTIAWTGDSDAPWHCAVMQDRGVRGDNGSCGNCHRWSCRLIMILQVHIGGDVNYVWLGNEPPAWHPACLQCWQEHPGQRHVGLDGTAPNSRRGQTPCRQTDCCAYASQPRSGKHWEIWDCSSPCTNLHPTQPSSWALSSCTAHIFVHHQKRKNENTMYESIISRVFIEPRFFPTKRRRTL